MERDLNEREKAGVPDAVLLEDYTNENIFLENLEKRFGENIIYTYIGQVLVSVNPYKELPIYSEEDVQAYRKKYFFEVPPHVFAVSDNAFRLLLEENRSQCILISGESGSGKTEASKKVLQFIAAASGHIESVESVKDKLVQTNPILEAFGNAKTTRNNNSSRFGKYMDINFNWQGIPDGGNILNYLLEKSRIVHQNINERNFHIFYQLISGADDALLEHLYLKRDLNTYTYLSNGDKTSKSTDKNLDDNANFRTVMQALKTIEMPEEEQRELIEIIASVLQLGNVTFGEDELGKAVVYENEAIHAVGKVLGIDDEKLRHSLTHRTIDANGDLVTSPLDRDMSFYARDALAKAVYTRLFDWLVTRINLSLQTTSSLSKSNTNHVLGILDIYGFEVFGTNNFEQLCINFCNEKLQQLFIELTLKQEQEEYLREGIEWEPVSYFNNKVICDLIEEKHIGIIALMDEECLRPGDATDLTLLEKMNERLTDHPHYIFSSSRASLLIRKSVGINEFTLRHYAGDVKYNVDGFLDKNNDLLFRNLKEAMSVSENGIMKLLFPENEFLKSRKRPNTAITQFKNSLNNLMDILVSKEPSYIRCIKPNDIQGPNTFDTEIIRHQVKYLGLMENLRVRRAGFAYRRDYEAFLQRYKCLSKRTWPNWHGQPRDGVQALIDDLKYDREDYRMGKTKIFIRLPKTLFATEDAFQHQKNYVASKIQARWKGRKQREKYLKIRAAIIIVQALVRRFLAKKHLEQRKKAVTRVRFFIRGFITRNDPPNECNAAFIKTVKQHWLIRLSKQLPKSFMLHTWPTPAPHCQEPSDLLKQMHLLQLARTYRLSLNEDRKKQFEMKVLAEDLFLNRKKNYQESVPNWFINERLTEQQKVNVNNFTKNSQFGEKVIYTTKCMKYDRHGYKPRERILIIGERSFFLLDAKSFKQKHRIPLTKLPKIVLTKERDGLLLIRIPLELKKDKGDLILDIPAVIECAVWFVMASKKNDMVEIVDSTSFSHNMLSGKSGTIQVEKGTAPITTITRAKSGNLLVIAAQKIKMGKQTKCSDLNLNDSGSFFFWGLIALLFVLVVGNFIITLTIISFFKIGMGMESIKLIPELKAIKFYGVTDFNKVYKKDGLIESFRESPAVIESDNNFIKFNLIDRKGQLTNRFMMGSNGTELKAVNVVMIRDPVTNLPIFSTSKLKYNMAKPSKNLEANIVHVAEVVSPIDKKLEFQSINMFIRGIEGTRIEGKEIFVSSEQNIFLKSSNGSITFNAQNGVYIDIDRIPVAPDVEYNQVRNDLQYKLCVCYPKGALYRVALSKLHGIDDPCRHFDKRQYNPCV
ncbi:CLUMA_CG010776, isoform A [Clunio marinus]|uniref:CLUMA_CG010776, isoform A n=1 Tax=Clunio marinus TaxID=568069 RepID=A0A1J1ICA6_9DIPT|nr:CLUMA_CG010776, isoform A [Clunio marinus]